MKKYFILLAIVVVGCKWRYDKVVKPDTELFLHLDTTHYKIIYDDTARGTANHVNYYKDIKTGEWKRSDGTIDKYIGGLYVYHDDGTFEVDSFRSIAELSRMVDAIADKANKKDSTIDKYQIWPASSGAKIHINIQDSGKGYIFRKYQNKLPKKHHWFPGMESTEGYKEACEAMDSIYNSIKIN